MWWSSNGCELSDWPHWWFVLCTSVSSCPQCLAVLSPNSKSICHQVLQVLFHSRIGHRWFKVIAPKFLLPNYSSSTLTKIAVQKQELLLPARGWTYVVWSFPMWLRKIIWKCLQLYPYHNRGELTVEAGFCKNKKTTLNLCEYKNITQESK
jgi:hypothetical protein